MFAGSKSIFSILNELWRELSSTTFCYSPHDVFFFFLIMFVILVLGHHKTFSSRLNICMKLERSQRERAVRLVEDSGNNLKAESSMKYYHTIKTERKHANVWTEVMLMYEQRSMLPLWISKLLLEGEEGRKQRSLISRSEYRSRQGVKLITT